MPRLCEACSPAHDDTTPMFPLSRIFFLRVKIDPARFQVKRFVKPYTSRLRAHATIRRAALAGARFCLSWRQRSGTRSGLLRVVVGEGDDTRRQPFGMAVEL